MNFIIAVVDDDEDVRDSTAILMEQYEWNIRLYESSTEFLTDVTNGKEPDCALIDLHLPKINGVEVIEELHNQNIQIPIIIMTVLTDHHLVSRAHDLGATVLHKPAISEKLIETIHDFFKP